MQEKLLREISGWPKSSFGVSSQWCRKTRTNFSANLIVPGTLAQLTSPALTPSAQVWLNTPLSLLPRVEPHPSPSLLSPATSPTLPSQHSLGHNGCCPLGTGLPRGIVGAGGWHWLCRETAGIVVPIINETALAAAPQPNPRN